MDNPKSIEPKNLTAQLHYRGIGNPPNSHPQSAISNSFPGLEADFRNVWTKIFKGITLHEASNLVVAVDDQEDPRFAPLLEAHYFLVKAHRISMLGEISGPGLDPAKEISGEMPLEWSNALADIVPEAGKKVTCIFENTDGRRKRIRLKLEVRHFFEIVAGEKGEPPVTRPVINQELAMPGELTQSLCSPWQNDYRECSCFYWAASRPDFVNVEAGGAGQSIGNNWMEKNRKPDPKKNYISDDAEEAARKLIDYQDLFTAWEKHLRFIIGGKDEPKPVVKKKKNVKK